MKQFNSSLSLMLLFGVLISCNTSKVQSTSYEKSSMLKVLILDGENNHWIWPKTTIMMKDYLEQTGRFRVDIARKKYTWHGSNQRDKEFYKRVALIEEFPIKDSKQTVAVVEPKVDAEFSPSFSEYDVVVSNLGWKASEWPEKTKQSFIEYMKNGGGLVVIHAANNSFGEWKEFNEMIGVGGWGGRNVESGPYIYFDRENNLTIDPSDGRCGSHGPQKEFLIKNRAPDHPIMKGLPAEWMHSKDELYENLRGPAKNVTVLATAFSEKRTTGPKENKRVEGTDRHEPMLMVINYGKGKIFHSTLGHMDYSMESVGFVTTLQRGAEWAATGEVTIPVPEDFPSAIEPKARKWGN